MATKGQLFIYDWQRGRAGAFKYLLAECMCRADTDNLELLKAGFPEEVDAMRSFHSEVDWWKETVEAIEDPEKSCLKLITEEDKNE